LSIASRSGATTPTGRGRGRSGLPAVVVVACAPGLGGSPGGVLPMEVVAFSFLPFFVAFDTSVPVPVRVLLVAGGARLAVLVEGGWVVVAGGLESSAGEASSPLRVLGAPF